MPLRILRGVITGEDSPLPIAGASVLSDGGATAVSDLDGYFTVTLGPDDKDITIVAEGYEVKTLAVKATDELIRVELRPASGAEVIQVSGKTPEETKPISYKLTVDEIRSIPGAGNDILRATTVLPGVARIPFSFGGLVLRGSSPRDSAVYLDGIEVPIAFHFGGITSFYPSGMLSDLTLTAGAFDAGYGRAQGGVVTLTTREPRTDRWRLGGSIGLFDSSIQAEGPLKSGGILIGVRRSYFDALARPFVASDIPLPSYLDFQVRTTFGDPRKRGRITPMIFGSIDRVSSDEIGITSAFVRAAVPYLRNWGKVTLRVTPWLGTNRLTLSQEGDPEFGEPDSEFSRPLYLGGVRSDITRDTAWGHLRGGLELSSGYLSQLNFGDEFMDGPDGDDPSLGGNSTLAWSDFALWGELRYKLWGDRASIKPGLRLEAYGLSGELAIDPRLNIAMQLTPTIALRQSIGRYSQPPTPGDVDPDGGNRELDGSHADQLTLGVDTQFPHEILASLTGFYSDVQDLGIKTRRPNSFDDGDPELGGLGPTFELLLEKQLGISQYRTNVGRGRNMGLELQVKRNVDGLFTMLSYTLANAQRVDDPRSGIGRRPFELDQRHNLQLVVGKQYTNWKFGARIQLVSGNPYTPTERYDPLTGEFIEGEPYSENLPTFFTLDLRADRRWHKCWGDLVLYFDIQNVTNRRNIEGREGINFETGQPDEIPGLPIIPFIGVEFLPLI